MRTNPATAQRLSRRQQQILAYIRDHIQQRGFGPSIREIGAAVELSSSSTVHSHLRALETKGYLKRNPNRPRSLQLVDAPLVPDRVAQLEALVREARGWVTPAANGELHTQWPTAAGQWLERAATLCPEAASA